MTPFTLIRNNLRYYRWTHASVVMGVIVTAAVLTGALGVGDSMRGTLETISSQRHGGAEFVMTTGERMFRSGLADDYRTYFRESGTASPEFSPALILPASGFNNDSSDLRIGGISMLGMDSSLRSFGTGWSWIDHALQPGKVVLNENLARKLQAGKGDIIFFRIGRPGRMPGDSPLATDDERSVAFRLEVSDVAEPGKFGNINLKIGQQPPLNAFVPLNWLQSLTELDGRANLLLVNEDHPGEKDDIPSVIHELNLPTKPVRKLEDYGLEMIHRTERNICEIRSREIFMDGRIFSDFSLWSRELSKTRQGEPRLNMSVFTYFVNELRSGDRSVYYSMVSGLGPDIHRLLQPDHPQLTHWLEPLPIFIGEGEIVINRWLADELDVEPGGNLTMRYITLNPDNSFDEKEIQLEVDSVVPMEKMAADSTLMPPFPGLEDSENCTDWDPGIPIDLDRIGQRDEVYWDQYRGTPRAFISYSMAQKLWGNRYGSQTSFRVQLPDRDNNPQKIGEIRNELLDYLRTVSGKFNLHFTDLKTESANARSQAMDFGGLFIGFSLFLIVSALLLTGLLFAFSIEQRSCQTGILLATGIGMKRVRNICLLEGFLLISSGSVVGALVGIFYTRAILWGLDRLWSDAVAGLNIDYHFNPVSLATGLVLTILMAMATIRVMTRLIADCPIRDLLAGDIKTCKTTKSGDYPIKTVICGYLLLASGTGIAASGMINGLHDPGLFFGAGALLLAGSLLVCRLRLVRKSIRSDGKCFDPHMMAGQYPSRRIGRSLATISLLAAGSFMLVAVQGNQRDIPHDSRDHASGTGGFRYWAETSLPLYKNINSSMGREHYGFDEEDFEGVELVPIRIQAGDEASCLNLNRAQQPKLFGIDPVLLSQRRSFTFSSIADTSRKTKGWLVMDESIQNVDDKLIRIPTVGDVNTITWALGKNIGDTVYIRNSRNEDIGLDIVGMISNSILQGGLVISEANMTRYFPSAGGYNACLIDLPDERKDFSAIISRGLEDYGLQITTAADRLDAFNVVSNTYLAVFQSLGGLGLVLGCIGLGVVVLRNVLERRRELALMRAVGFTMRQLRTMILREHQILLFTGLFFGVLAGLVAVLPVLATSGRLFPWKSMTISLAAMLINGLLWIRIATLISMKGQLLKALRNE